MSIVVAVKRNGQISIATDTLTTLGRLKITSDYVEEHNKIIEVGASFVGIVGWSATAQILEHIVHSKRVKLDLSSRFSIFETFLSLHRKLEGYYLVNSQEDEGEPVQSSQINALVINNNGIFEVTSHREVSEYKKFWAIGAGSPLALGAMHALYENKNLTAKDIAIAGVNAAVEFDDSCGLPVKTKSINLSKKLKSLPSKISSVV